MIGTPENAENFLRNPAAVNSATGLKETHSVEGGKKSGLRKGLALVFLAAGLAVGYEGFSTHGSEDAAQPGIAISGSAAQSGDTTAPEACAETPADAPRGLTEGEKRLARSIFGDEINLSGVQLRFVPDTDGRGGATTYSGTRIDFRGPEQTSSDFSHEESVLNFGIFMHEMTHIWQFQQADRYTPNLRHHEYLYHLETKSKFTDYSVEQQAAVIEDYAGWFLHPEHKMRWLPQIYYGGGGELDKQDLLMKVVEDQFPAARKARLDYQARHAVSVSAAAPRPSPG